MQMDGDERTAKVKTIRKTRKRKEPVVDVEIERESSTKKFQNVLNISDDDVENYRTRNEQLWKYFFDDNNFKCANPDK